MLKRLFALAVLTALVAAGLYYAKLLPAGLVPWELGGLGRRLEEAKLTGAVTAALRLNRHTRDGRIDVSSEEGIVTLRGEVGRDETRQAAEQIAAAVPHVRQVVNHLKVVASRTPPPGERSLGESLDDRTLEVEVRLALSLRRELRGSDIDVKAFRRHVRLTGMVESEAARQVAVATARDTAGVVEVEDALRLRGSPPRDPPPKGGREAAQRAVAASPHLSKYSIRVVEEDGRLVLRGRVRTGAEKDLAGLLAQEAASARIENALQIRP